MKLYETSRTRHVEVRNGRILLVGRNQQRRSTSSLFVLALILLCFSIDGFSIDSLKRNLVSNTLPKKQPPFYYATTSITNSTLLIQPNLSSDHQKNLCFVRNNNETRHWETDWDQQHQALVLFEQDEPTVQPEQEEPSLEPTSIVSVTTARWLLVSAAALYGTNFAAVKYLVEDIPVGVFGTLRFGLAAFCTLPWLLSNDDTTQWKDSTTAGLEVGLWTSLGYVAQAVGLETTLASTSAFVCSLAVVVVPLLDFVRGKPLERKEQVYGIVMACLGVGLLELGDASSMGLGDALSLVQPFAFGIGFMRMEQAMRLFPSEARRMTAAQLLAVFFTSAAFMIVRPDENFNLTTDLWPLLHDPMVWAGLVWTGIVTTGLTVYMETVALQTLSAAETTLIFSTEPLWGSVAAAFLLGESFGPKAMLGGGLIVSACLISNLGVDGIRDFVTLRAERKQSYTKE